MSLTIPYISIKPGYVTFFSLPENRRYGSDISQRERANLKQNKPNGIISHKAKRRICTAIDWMLYLSSEKTFFDPRRQKSFKFKLNFVTLTLPSKQVHSDQVIKNKCLNQFLIELKRDFFIKRYVWRAEPQANGNIHFHIVTDKFIPWSQLRKSWNRIIEKLGYVTRYGDEMREWHKDGFRVRRDLLKYWSEEKQKKAYKEGMRGNWSNPNSTDVHSIYKVRNLSAYLAKYMAKETDYVNKRTGDSRTYPASSGGKTGQYTIHCVQRVPKYRPIEGKLWGLSHSLSKLQSVVLGMSTNVYNEITRVITAHRNRLKQYDFYSVLYLNLKKWIGNKTPVIYQQMRDYIKSVTSETTVNKLQTALFTPQPPPTVIQASVEQLKLHFRSENTTFML